VTGRLAIAALLFAVLLAACSTPAPTPAPSAPPDPTVIPMPVVTAGPATVSDADGPFQLELQLPRTSFSASEPVTGQAVLSTTDGKDAAVAGSGSGLVHFSYEEIGGTRRMGAAWTDDCTPWTIPADDPLATDLRPAGDWSEDDPNAAFYKAFATAPNVRLPLGAWIITATASFLGPGCTMPVHDLEASTLVVITP
jgi:hypothetical protein